MPGIQATDRVVRALSFQPPLDRAPRFFNFWSRFKDAWHAVHGANADIDRHYGNDVIIAAADETPWPLAAAVLKSGGGVTTRRTGWGAVEETRDDAYFSRVSGVALPERSDPESLKFDDPHLDSRYRGAIARAEAHRGGSAVFAKTGGPYMRCSFMRGRETFLMDIAEDPDWVRSLVDRVTDHIMTVGVESLKRFRLQYPVIGIYDDVCSSTSPIMGAATYERLFYPALCKMVTAYKKAGAEKVFHHCDGNVADLLEMWVAAGIDFVHPLEPRAGPDPAEVRKRFGNRLAIMGGLDNCIVLPEGDPTEIRRHVRHLLDVAAGGGLIIAPHSIGADISIDTMERVRKTLDDPTARGACSPALSPCT